MNDVPGTIGCGVADFVGAFGGWTVATDDAGVIAFEAGRAAKLRVGEGAGGCDGAFVAVFAGTRRRSDDVAGSVLAIEGVEVEATN